MRDIDQGEWTPASPLEVGMFMFAVMLGCAIWLCAVVTIWEAL